MSKSYLLVGYLPVLLLPFLIALKILLRNKFNNIIFYSILFIIFVYVSTVLCVIAMMVIPTLSVNIEYPFFHKINTLFSVLSVIYFSFYPIFFIIIYPIIIFIRIKTVNVTKNFTLVSLFLIILLLFSLPTIVSPQLCINKGSVILKDIEQAKIAADISLLPPMQVYYADYVAINIDNYFSKKFVLNNENPDFSSNEAKSLIEDYLKYKKITAKLASYYDYMFIALFCKKIKKYDEALEYLSIAEKYGVKVDKIRDEILKTKQIEKKES